MEAGSGEVFISVLLRQLSARAVSLPDAETALPCTIEDGMRKLSRTLRVIHPLVGAAERCQGGDGRVRAWLEELREVAYDVDDALDDLVSGAASFHRAVEEEEAAAAAARKNPFRHWMRLLSTRFLSPFIDVEVVSVSSAHQIEGRLRALGERLHELAEDWSKCSHLRGIDAARGPAVPLARETSSLMEGDVVGREIEKQRILRELLEEEIEPVSDPRYGVSVISIVGMAGIGKTALAQSVFNDQRVSEHFSLRKWVYVGESFDVKKIIQGITRAATPDTCLDNLHLGLVQILEDQTSLIVLDDVWCESCDEWDKLLLPFRYARRRCKVIVTTRSQKVTTNLARPLLSVPLMPLSDEDCWKIFERCAFVDGDSDSYPTLKEIGRSIVQKLNGVPLAARTVGSHLVSTLEERKWRSILCNEGLLLAQSLLPILQISYRHLPPHLKPCFKYCSIFPRGHKFERKGLVQMWMAQGFLQPEGGRSIEDIGNDYFDDLLQRSFFQYIHGYYVMPDLIHNLSQLISTGECFRLGDGKLSGNKRARHLSFSYNGFEHFEYQSLHKFKKVRTLIYLREHSSVFSDSVPCYLFRQLKCIRVLDLSHSEIRYLPASVGDLKHLRYLDLSFTKIEDLPDSLCCLHNLQTLKLAGIMWLRLPEGLCNLINLRYIDADADLFAEITRIGKLTYLQELKICNVHNEKGHEIGELKDMRELGGSLCIRNLDNVQSGVEAGQAKLTEKLRLVELKLEWEDKFHATPNNVRLNEEVLEALQPPPYLKVLEIKCNKAVKFPRWMETSLPSTLTSISVYNCRKWEALPPFGELPFLISLQIGGMYGVKQVGREFYGNGLFPALNKLEFEDMLELEGWVVLDELQLFPSLKTLRIIKCPRLKELPRLPPSLTELVIWEVGLHALPEMQTLPSTNLKPLSKDLKHPLTNLAKIDIRKCEELSQLTSSDLHVLSSLVSLRIEGCPKITLQLPKGWSLSLQHLYTDNSQFLTWLLPQTSSCLRELLIHNCSELESFTSEEEVTWRDLTNLKELYIWDCHNLHSLPIGLGSLSSLVTMDIRGCPKVQCLPEEDLPPSLQYLHIGGCELLAECCQEGMGPDWPKIAHIPFLRII